jgi:predicted NBD/HSP70 family sugar kinase
LAGIGVAAPSFIVGKWEEQLNAPPEVMVQWKNLDIRAQISTPGGPPVYLAKDTTAACLAELMFGSGLDFPNYLYVFVGSFIGGGIVLNGALYPGVFGNAGAVGSIPVPDFDADGRLVGLRQLIDCASLFLLEDMLSPFGLSPDQALSEGSSEIQQMLDDWTNRSAKAIAHAIASACAVIDFDGVIVDGTMPHRLLDTLVGKISNNIETMRLDGVVRPWVRGGSIGAKAATLGGAILPLYSNFAPNGIILDNLPD